MPTRPPLFWLAVNAAFCGCWTAPLASPWPCDRVEDRPAVDAELLEMKATREAILWDGQKAVYAQPGEEGLYRATRELLVDFDSACAANRVLAGEDPSKLKPLSWWQRLFRWIFVR